MRKGFVAALVLCAGPLSAAPSVERGEYLVRGPMGCGNCHTPLGPEGFESQMELGGRLVEKSPMFTIYSSNITPGGAVGGWSDGDLARAIREGVRPDGTIIGPPMPIPMYRHISNDDLASIVMFLRTVPAVENEVPKSTYDIPLPPTYGPPVQSVAAPAPGVTAEWGEYVARLSHCMECHSPMGPQGPMADAEHLGSGGMEFAGPDGIVTSPDITPHEDGIAGYDDATLKRMITQGINAEGEPMHPPMPYPFLARMTPEDLDALVLYLRGLPPLPDAG